MIKFEHMKVEPLVKVIKLLDFSSDLQRTRKI